MSTLILILIALAAILVGVLVVGGHAVSRTMDDPKRPTRAGPDRSGTREADETRETRTPSDPEAR